MSGTTPLRLRLTDDLKTAMKAAQPARVSTIRMILARLKELDIASRPKGLERIGDDDAVGAMRAMVKSRHEAAALYRQGGRAELAQKEEDEVAVIESYLPAGLDAAALAAAVEAAVAETGAASQRDLGRVMAALKARHGASLDMARASAAARVLLPA